MYSSERIVKAFSEKVRPRLPEKSHQKPTEGCSTLLIKRSSVRGF